MIRSSVLPLKEIPIWQRRTGRRYFCYNAFLWGIGNGLISSSLVTYIIFSLAGPFLDKAMIGVAISWIIAAPRLVGLLRLLTPSLIDWTGSRKRICFWGSLLSPMILLLLPGLTPFFATQGARYLNLSFSLIGLIWAFYHLIEYFSTVSLWSWIGDSLVPQIRIRFLARRERWMIAGQFLGMLTAGLYTWYQKNGYPESQSWRVYLFPAFLGIAFLITAAFTIVKIPEVQWNKVSGFRTRFRQLVQPLSSGHFLAFLLFACWIQIANGLTQSTQYTFQLKVLNVSMFVALMFQAWTRIGQMAFTRIAARLLEQNHFFGILGTAYMLVSIGSLCYAVATPDSWFLIFGAATLWIFWVAVNIGINNLLINLSVPENRNATTALYFTISTLAFGIASFAGGWICDHCKDLTVVLPGTNRSLDYYQLAFFGGTVLRLFGIVFLIICWALLKRKANAK